MICVNSVCVTPKEINLQINKWFYDACATVCPNNADCKSIEWSSDNPNVASVNENTGYIYGNALGTTRVYAKAKDGSECRDYITVTVKSTIPVESITINRSNLSLQKDTSTVLSAIVCPANATNQTLTWTSSDTAVATVSNGVITGVSQGYATIMASAADGSGKSASCLVNVTGDILVTSVTVTPNTKTMIVGNSDILREAVCPTNATKKSVCWSSSNSAIVTVNPNTGLIVAQSAGTAYVYATACDGSGVYGCCAVTVNSVDNGCNGIGNNNCTDSIGIFQPLSMISSTPENAETEAPVMFGIQFKEEQNGNYSIRFISQIKTLNYKVVGHEIYSKFCDDVPTFHTLSSKVVYTSVIAAEKTVCPDEGFNYFVVGVIENIPKNMIASFNIIPFVTTLEGEKLCGSSTLFGCENAQQVDYVWFEAPVAPPDTEDNTNMITVPALRTTANCWVRTDTVLEESTILKNASGEKVVLEVDQKVALLQYDWFENKNWYQILYDGMMCYVTADSFEITTMQVLNQPPCGTAVKVDTKSTQNLNIRKKPKKNSDNDIIGQFADGSTVILTNDTPQNGKWYSVYEQTVNGNYTYGWCSGEYLCKEIEMGTLIDVGSLTVRSAPGTSNTKLGTIYRGDSVQILEKECASASGYTWHKILFNGNVGYVVAGNNTPNFSFETIYNSLSVGNEELIEIVQQNIDNCSITVIPKNKKNTAKTIFENMYNAGYEISFIAGMLGNIVYEGNIGTFESSNYVSNPESKPDYLVYMDTNYSGVDFYKNNYSGKNITEVDVQSVYNILNNLRNASNNTWRINGSRVGFGLGCIQWTFARTYNLVAMYLQKNNNGTTITEEQAIQAEAQMILDELQTSLYKNIYTSWKAQNQDCETAIASENAGELLCRSYLVPYNTNTQAAIRSLKARTIYEEIVTNVF